MRLLEQEDSDKSQRSVLTLQPLAASIGKNIDSSYPDGHYQKLADHLRKRAEDYAGSSILICWHHGKILDLAAALGAFPEALPEISAWPERWSDEVFGWLLMIYVDSDGKLKHKKTRAMNERLMPDDTVDPVYNNR